MAFKLMRRLFAVLAQLLSRGGRVIESAGGLIRPGHVAFDAHEYV
jgi:hypothetical protein